MTDRKFEKIADIFLAVSFMCFSILIIKECGNQMEEREKIELQQLNNQTNEQSTKTR